MPAFAKAAQIAKTLAEVAQSSNLTPEMKKAIQQVELDLNEYTTTPSKSIPQLQKERQAEIEKQNAGQVQLLAAIENPMCKKVQGNPANNQKAEQTEQGEARVQVSTSSYKPTTVKIVEGFFNKHPSLHTKKDEKERTDTSSPPSLAPLNATKDALTKTGENVALIQSSTQANSEESTPQKVENVTTCQTPVCSAGNDEVYTVAQTSSYEPQAGPSGTIPKSKTDVSLDKTISEDQSVGDSLDDDHDTQASNQNISASTMIEHHLTTIYNRGMISEQQHRILLMLESCVPNSRFNSLLANSIDILNPSYVDALIVRTHQEMLNSTDHEHTEAILAARLEGAIDMSSRANIAYAHQLDDLIKRVSVTLQNSLEKISRQTEMITKHGTEFIQGTNGMMALVMKIKSGLDKPGGFQIPDGGRNQLKKWKFQFGPTTISAWETANGWKFLNEASPGASASEHEQIVLMKFLEDKHLLGPLLQGIDLSQVECQEDWTPADFALYLAARRQK